MSKLNMDKVQIAWMQDILQRMKSIVESNNYSESDKIVALRYLIKQALKADAE